MLDGILILAAGEGSRMAPFSEQVPKPFFNIDGKPLIQHTIDYAKSEFPDVPVIASAQSKHLHWFSTIEKLDGIVLNNTGSNYYPVLQLTGKYVVFCADLLLKRSLDLKRAVELWDRSAYAAAVFPMPKPKNCTRHGDQLTPTIRDQFIKSWEFQDQGEYILSGISLINTQHHMISGISFGGFNEMWKMVHEARGLEFFTIGNDGWHTFDTIREIADYEDSRPSFTRDVKELIEKIRQAHEVEEMAGKGDPGPK